MKSTTRPTRTRATYRRSDSADTTGAAKARQRRLKRNDDRAESIAQERRIGPEPGATVRASVRARSHGYGKTRPDDGAKSRRRGRWTAERIVLECPISFRSCPQRRPSRCSFTTVAPPQRRWTGDSTAQSKGKRGSPARAGTTRLSFRRRQRVRKLSAVRPCFGPRFMQQPWPPHRKRRIGGRAACSMDPEGNRSPVRGGSIHLRSRRAAFRAQKPVSKARSSDATTGSKMRSTSPCRRAASSLRSLPLTA